MNKPPIFLLIFCLYFLGCEQNQSRHERIEKFESILGEGQSKALNKIVSKFDSHLEKYDYESYSAFLRSFKNPDAQIIIEQIQKNPENQGLWELTKNSQLEQEIRFTLDSIYVLKTEIRQFYHRINDKDTIVWGQKFNPTEPISKPITKEVLDRRISDTQLNIYGNFFEGLAQVQKSDSLIINYLDAKKAVGDISLVLIAGGLLYDEPVNEDYFFKRIVVSEFFLPFIPRDIKIIKKNN